MSKLVTLPKGKKESNSEYCYRVIRYNIMNFYLQPGETVNENDIAGLLNVSRTPVHEALMLLKTEQLVNIIPQSGSKVSLISLEHVREGLFIRSSVEPLIYRQIAGSLSEKHLQAMSECIKKANALLDSNGDDYEFILLDDEFHKIAYIAAHKPNVWNATKKVCSHYDMIRFHDSSVVKENKKKIMDEHMILFEYLLSGGKGDFDIFEFYEVHLTRFKEYFTTFYFDHPEFFMESVPD